MFQQIRLTVTRPWVHWCTVHISGLSVFQCFLAVFQAASVRISFFTEINCSRCSAVSSVLSVWILFFWLSRKSSDIVMISLSVIKMSEVVPWQLLWVPSLTLALRSIWYNCAFVIIAFKADIKRLSSKAYGTHKLNFTHAPLTCIFPCILFPTTNDASGEDVREADSKRYSFRKRSCPCLWTVI